MAQATDHSITTPLSRLLQDPVLRDAFERAERDSDPGGCLVSDDHPPSLDGGAAELLTGSGARRVPALVE